MSMEHWNSLNHWKSFNQDYPYGSKIVINSLQSPVQSPWYNWKIFHALGDAGAPRTAEEHSTWRLRWRTVDRMAFGGERRIKQETFEIKNDNWTLYHLSILGLNVQQIWMFIAMPGKASMRNTARSARSAPWILVRNCLFQTNAAWSILKPKSRLQIHKVHARHLAWSS